MRYIELFEHLTESRSAPLYHHMYAGKVFDIFKKDMMPAKWEHDIPNLGTRLGNSFTRNREYRRNDRPVCLSMDQEKLAAHNKIVPLDGEFVFQHKYGDSRYKTLHDRIMNADGGQLAEEFVIGDIKNLHRCIAHIEVKNTYSFLTPAEVRELVETVKDYAEKYSIPYTIHAETLKREDDYIRNFDLDEAREAAAKNNDALYAGQTMLSKKPSSSLSDSLSWSWFVND